MLGSNGGRLWAPWRRRYLTQGPPKGCLFCQAHRAPARRRHLVVHHGQQAFALLNLYPYNNGHVLVAPYRHLGRLDQLTEREWLDLWRVTREMMARLDRVVTPQGYNLGVNLGRAAGAGVPGHLHLHIVPRWIGDTNFMPVTGQTKVISDSLEALRRRLRRPRPRRR